MAMNINKKNMRQIIFNNFINSAISIISKQMLHKFKSNLCGIYIIKNNITNDCYIGQAKNIKRRILDHKVKLKDNKHVYKNGEPTLLQRAWNKYGEDNFSFDFIELCNKEDLNEKEIYWIKHYKCNRIKYGFGYNLNDGGSGQHKGGTGNKGKILINNGQKQLYIHPSELNYYEEQGYTKGMLDKYIQQAIEHKSTLCGEDHPNYGKRWSKETREKIEKYYKEREGFVSPLLGRHHSEERKRQMSEAMKGKIIHENSLNALKENIIKHQRSVIQSTLDGIDIEEFNSIKEAHEKTGVSSGNIVSCCKGNRPNAGGYLWRYKYE